MSEQVNLEYPIIPSEKFGIEISDEKRAERLFYEEGGLKELVDNIRGDVANFVIQNDEDRVFIAKCVKKSATALEKYGKSVADNVKRIPKIVDGNRRFAADALEALHDAIMLPITEAKARRKRLDAIAAIPATRSMATIAELDTELQRLYDIAPAEFAELADEFTATRERVQSELLAIKAKRQQEEADKAELERRRAEDAKRDEEARMEAARADGERRARERMAAEQAVVASAHNNAETARVVTQQIAETARVVTQQIAEEGKQLVADYEATYSDIKAVIRTNGFGDLAANIISAIQSGKIRNVTTTIGSV